MAERAPSPPNQGDTLSTEAPEYVDLISPHASLTIILRHNQDEYTQQGGLRLVQPGRHVKFTRGRARVPASWLPEIQSHEAWRDQMVFLAEDPKAPALGPQGPIVVTGQGAAGSRVRSAAPLENWDTTGSRELRTLILAGKVPDLVEAMTYEVGHRNRAVVVTALSQAIRGGAEPEEDIEEPPDSIPIPPTAARGL